MKTHKHQDLILPVILLTTGIQIIFATLQSSNVENENALAVFIRLFFENSLLVILLFILFSLAIKISPKGLLKKTRSKNLTLDLALVSLLLLNSGRQIINIITNISGDVTTNFLEIESDKILNLLVFTFGSPGLDGISWGLKIISIILPLSLSIYFSNRGEKIFRGILIFLVTYLTFFLYTLTPVILTFCYKLPTLGKVTVLDLTGKLASVENILEISKTSVLEYKNITIGIPIYIVISSILLSNYLFSFKHLKNWITHTLPINIWSILFLLSGTFIGYQFYPRSLDLKPTAILIFISLIIDLILLNSQIKLSLYKNKRVHIRWLKIVPIFAAFLIDPIFAIFFSVYFLINHGYQYLPQKKTPIMRGLRLGLLTSIALIIGYLIITPDQNLTLFPLEIILALIISFAVGYTYQYFDPNYSTKVKKKKLYLNLKFTKISISKKFLASLFPALAFLWPAILFENIFFTLISLTLALIIYMSQNFFVISYKRYRILLFLSTLILIGSFLTLIYNLEITL